MIRREKVATSNSLINYSPLTRRRSSTSPVTSTLKLEMLDISFEKAIGASKEWRRGTARDSGSRACERRISLRRLTMRREWLSFDEKYNLSLATFDVEIQWNYFIMVLQAAAPPPSQPSTWPSSPPSSQLSSPSSLSPPQ